MYKVDPKNTPTKDLHQFLLGSVSPRPIAFVSTISKDGEMNLAPYSFFNCFSSNPPILVFSSNRRVSNNTTKDTLRNVEETGEVVINVVSHHIVRQMALASVDYPSGVSEFDKAGFTPIPSETIRPFRVKESHVQMECTVDNIISLGDKGGAGNLIVCRVNLMHINPEVMTGNRIDPHKIDLMGRMGRMWYVRASGAAVSEVVQDMAQMGVGFDSLPSGIRKSRLLTGNHLAQIAALTALPSPEEADAFLATDAELKEVLTKRDKVGALHRYIRRCLDANDIQKAAHLAVFAL